MKFSLKSIALIAMCAGVMLAAGCASTNRTLYNTESLAVDGVIGGVHGFNQYCKSAVEADPTAAEKLQPVKDKVYADVADFHVTIDAIDRLRVSYALNSAKTNLTAIQVLLATAGDQSSNIVYDVKWFMSHPVGTAGPPAHSP